MSTQTLSGHSFPTPCKKCGGALNRQVEYCPYCGTVNPLGSTLHQRTFAAGNRAGARLAAKFAQANPFDSTLPAAASENAALATTLQPSTLATMNASLPQPVEAPYGLPVEYTEGYTRPRIMTRNTLLGVAVVAGLGLVLGGYALLRPDGDADSSRASQASRINKDATMTTGSIALYMPAQSTSQQQRAITQTTALNATKPLAAPVKAAPAIPVTPVMPLVAPAPVKPAAPQYRDVNQALQAARAAMRTNNLSVAQNALAAAQTLQPGNATAQALSQDMKPALAQRDNAMQAAQTCFAQQSWSCARQHANEALTADSGSEAASAMLERIITQTGWAPLNLHATTSAAPPQSPLQSLPLQARTPAKTPGNPSNPTNVMQQQASLQRPLPAYMPAANDTSSIVPLPGQSAQSTQSTQSTQAAQPTQPALDPNSVEARERAIRDSGWSRAASANR